MVNQQLLDYIKQQLGQNVSKEQIKSSLMSGGWLVSDVEEGFNAIAPQPAPIPRAPSIISNIQPIQPIQSTQPIQPIQHIQPISNLINPTIQQPSFTKQEKPKTGRKAILFLIILIILAGGGYFALKYFDNSKTNNAPAQTSAVNQEENQTPPATTPTPASVAENPDITRVKAILVDIGQGEMTGNINLILEHMSAATAKLTKSSATNQKVSSFTVNSVYQSGANIVASVTTTGGPSDQPPTQNLVFIKENDDWKLDMFATMQYGITTPQTSATQTPSPSSQNQTESNPPLRIYAMSIAPSDKLTYPFSGNTLNVVLKNNSSQTIKAYQYAFFLDENDNLDNYNGVNANNVNIPAGGVFSMKSSDTQDAVGDALKRACDFTGMTAGQYHLHLKISPAIINGGLQGIGSTDTGPSISDMSVSFTLTNSCKKTF
jgi:hypothetical protein